MSTETATQHWQSTQMESAIHTRLLGDADRPDQAVTPELGKRLNDTEHEVFVMGESALALNMPLEQIRPRYMVLHDLGSGTSLKLLVSLAAAAKTTVQRLRIRRMGYGHELARLSFAELPLGPVGAPGPTRLYATDSHASDKAALAKLMLSHAHLSVLLIGALSEAQLGEQLQSLGQDLRQQGAPCRNLLLLPLSQQPQLGAMAQRLGAQLGGHVVAAPTVNRSADAWQYMAATWSKVTSAVPPGAASSPPVSVVANQGGFDRLSDTLPVGELTLAPMHPDDGGLGRPTVPGELDNVQTSRFMPFLRQLQEVPGVMAACLQDTNRTAPLASVGSSGVLHTLADITTVWYQTLSQGAQELGSRTLTEALITLDRHLVLLSPLPDRPALRLCLLLDRQGANLPLVRAHLTRISAVLPPL